MGKNKVRTKMELKRGKGHLIVGSVLLIFGGIAFAIFDFETLGVGLAAPGLVLFIAGLYRQRNLKQSFVLTKECGGLMRERDCLLSGSYLEQQEFYFWCVSIFLIGLEPPIF